MHHFEKSCRYERSELKGSIQLKVSILCESRHPEVGLVITVAVRAACEAANEPSGHLCLLTASDAQSGCHIRTRGHALTVSAD